jgi:hypothetical protein
MFWLITRSETDIHKNRLKGVLRQAFCISGNPLRFRIIAAHMVSERGDAKGYAGVEDVDTVEAVL